MRTLKEEVAYCQSKGFFRNTIELSTMLSWLGEQAVKDYRIAAIESKVLELEAIDAARTSAVQDAIDTAAIYQDQLTASRQQVERLVEALTEICKHCANPITQYGYGTQGKPWVRLADFVFMESREALADVEKERGTSKVTGWPPTNRSRSDERYSRVCKTLAMEVRHADELLRALRLDPEIYRTECGYINMPKVRAALAHPDEYPMMPNAPHEGEPACGRSPRCGG